MLQQNLKVSNLIGGGLTSRRQRRGFYARKDNKNKEEPSVTKADSLPINPGDCQFSDEYEFVEPTPKAKKKGNAERES